MDIYTGMPRIPRYDSVQQYNEYVKPKNTIYCHIPTYIYNWRVIDIKEELIQISTNTSIGDKIHWNKKIYIL